MVIFARFIPEVLEIIKRSESIIGKSGMKTVAIYGAIPKEQRGDIVQQFQKDPSTMVLVGQIDTAGTGITLTAADTCVYYSVTFNYATYSQSLARIHRIGQRNTCTYIHLVAENTVDSTILKSLSKKRISPKRWSMTGGSSFENLHRGRHPGFRRHPERAGSVSAYGAAAGGVRCLPKIAQSYRRGKATRRAA